MNRFLPKSIASQTIIVLLIGLTISHVFSMTIYTADRADVATVSGGHQIAHQIAAITRLLEKTPTAWQSNILQATNSQTLSVSVTPVSLLHKEDSGGVLNTLLRKYLAGLIGAGDEERVVVQVIDAKAQSSASAPQSIQFSALGAMGHMFQEQIASGQLIRASVHLRNGQWLNFATAVPSSDSFWSIKTVLSMSLMAVGVVLISFWVIRRVTRPLRVFTEASKRLGKDVTAPPLEIEGPSELRDAVIAFNEMQQRLRQLVENRTRMLAAISHDLRTPITLLRLRTETVEDEEEKTSMQTTLDEMEEMISSTMAFARDDAEREPVEQVNLSALVGSICVDLSDTGHKVDFIEKDAVIHACRPGALKRALSNLIGNAIKFGTTAQVTLQKAESTIEITIDDDGPGIPQEDLSHVFDPFYRVDKSRNKKIGGVGLGLSIAQSIIDKHGGKIELSNLVEEGLRVRIILPM